MPYIPLVNVGPSWVRPSFRTHSRDTHTPTRHNTTQHNTSSVNIMFCFLNLFACLQNKKRIPFSNPKTYPQAQKQQYTKVTHTHTHTTHIAHANNHIYKVHTLNLSLVSCWKIQLERREEKRTLAMSKQTYRVCFCCRRRFKLALSEAPPEIRALFDRYSDNGLMTASNLRSFMAEVQRQEKTTEEEAQAIIDGLKHLSIFHRRGLNLESFFKYLFSDNNPPLSPSREVNFLFYFFHLDSCPMYYLVSH